MGDDHVGEASHVYLDTGKLPHSRSSSMSAIDDKKVDTISIGVADLLRFSNLITAFTTDDLALTSVVATCTIVGISDSSPGCTTSSM